MGLPLLAGIGLAVAGGSAIYQGIEAHKAESQAEDQAAQQKADQEKMIADQKKKEADQETLAKATDQQLQQRQRQQALAASSLGRGGTILTGPTGLSVTGQAPPQGAYKTLLGQ